MKDSYEFCESIFNKISGRAALRLGGQLVGFDQKRKEVFIKIIGRKTAWMPAAEFCNHLNKSEIEELESLPDWNGNNEYKLNICILRAARLAMTRFNKQAPPNSTILM